jgi:sugar phosphate permease
VSTRPAADSIMTNSTDTPACRVENVMINRTRLAWSAWSLGAAAYAVAVFQRSSLGMAGIEAAHHFGVGPALLSALTTLQLLVYAAMQIPVGLLVDRFGPRRLLTTGLLLMALGQCAFALTESVGAGVAARVLVGCGDAMTFVSVLRLASAWFPPRRSALLTQLTSLAGIMGNLVAAAPLSLLLRTAGWTPAFLVAASVAVLVLVPVATLMRDRPGAVDADVERPAVSVREQLSAAWSRPGTRLGMWVHFTTQFSGVVFSLLWGYPFLAQAQGLDASTASAFISLQVVSMLVFAQVFGVLLSRWPGSRLPLAFSSILMSIVSWAVVLTWPGHAPLPVLALHVVVLGTSVPASMIGFELARDANPTHQLGTASGLVNVGGFGASVVTTLAIGAALELVPDGYRVAFALQFFMYAVGLTAMVRLARTVRRDRATRPTPAEAAREQAEALA